jgi:hypothetical protein
VITGLVEARISGLLGIVAVFRGIPYFLEPAFTWSAHGIAVSQKGLNIYFHGATSIFVLAFSRDEQIKEIFHGVNELHELFEVFTAVHISIHSMMNMEAARPINVYSLDLIEKLHGLVDLYESSNTTQNWTDEFGAIFGVKFASHGCVFLKMPRVFVRSKGNVGVGAKLGEAPAIPGSRGNVVRLDDAVIKRG